MTIPSRTARGLGWDYERLAGPMRRQAVGRQCPRCGVTMTRQVGRETHPSDATIDHRTPRALGGTNTLDNLVAVCRRCNIRAGARLGGLRRAARRRALRRAVAVSSRSW